MFKCAVQALTITFFLVFKVNAAGMIPETSVVLIEVSDGEGVISVKNTDAEAGLLYTSIENVPEDLESILFVTPPVARVESGEKQLVRLILKSTSPITTQRLKRVTFEGIPQKDPTKPSKIGVNVRQNLPVIISPKGLPSKSDPWTLLSWKITGGVLQVKNNSAYVVRLNMILDLLPSLTRLSLKKTYILPGDIEEINLPPSVLPLETTNIRIYPVSIYGYKVKPFDASLSD